MLHANKRMTVDRFTNNTWIEDTGASYHVTKRIQILTSKSRWEIAKI